MYEYVALNLKNIMYAILMLVEKGIMLSDYQF